MHLAGHLRAVMRAAQADSLECGINRLGGMRLTGGSQGERDVLREVERVDEDTFLK